MTWLRTRRMKPTATRLAATTLLAVFVFLMQSSAPIYDDSGQRLESLFVDIEPSAYAGVVNEIAPHGFSACQDPGEPGVLGALAAWFRIKSVYADIDCESEVTECMGHYMVADYRSCHYSCGGGYEHFIVWPEDDNQNYDDGYLIEPYDVCCGARCAEAGCPSDY